MNSISTNNNIVIKASRKLKKYLLETSVKLKNYKFQKGPSDFVTNSDLKAKK